MQLTALASLAASLVILPYSPPTSYQLTANVVGNEFYHFFNFFTAPDPTHGRVNYVNRETALSQNLTYASDDRFVLRAESKTVLPASGPGRNSVRLRSNGMFTTHVAIFDIEHMPTGCGTWPAVWETDDRENRWPFAGEIDIIEGANNVSPNKVALHTTPGCVMPGGNANHTGTSQQLDCDVAVNFNAGCGINVNETPSFGPAFNAISGGWYALERTNAAIRVWFWPRNSPNVPAEVKYKTGSVDPSTWGRPSTNFPSTSQCDLASKFGPNFVIINLSLCGDWAGQPTLFSAAGCSGTCADHVNNSPEAFTEAYFNFRAIRIYE